MKFHDICRIGLWILIALILVISTPFVINAIYCISFEDYFGVNINSILGFRFSLNDEEIQILQPVVDRRIREYSSQYLMTLDKRNNLLKNIPTNVTKEAVNIIEQLKDINNVLERRQGILDNAIGAAKYFDFKIEIDHTQR